MTTDDLADQLADVIAGKATSMMQDALPAADKACRLFALTVQTLSDASVFTDPATMQGNIPLIHRRLWNTLAAAVAAEMPNDMRASTMKLLMAFAREANTQLTADLEADDPEHKEVWQ